MSEANARLIAASPTMLGVLMNVETYLRDRLGESGMAGSPEVDLWRSVRDVIEQATGEPPP